MSLIALNGLNEVREAVLAKEGLYTLQCVKTLPPKKDKNGALMFNVVFQVESDDPNVEYANVFDNISLPGEADEPDRMKFKLLMIKRRLFWLDLADSIANNSMDPADFVGQRTVVPVKLTQEEYQGTYSNRISWPKLPDEE